MVFPEEGFTCSPCPSLCKREILKTRLLGLVAGRIFLGTKEPSLPHLSVVLRGVLPHKASSIPVSFAFISSQECQVPEGWESIPLQSPLVIGSVRWLWHWLLGEGALTTTTPLLPPLQTSRGLAKV